MDPKHKVRLHAAMIALEGRTHAEVARLTGGLISSETVSNIRRDRNKLRTTLTTIVALEIAAAALEAGE